MSANYPTTNKSQRDVNQQFDIKDFNIKFEANDEKLLNSKKDDCTVKVNEIIKPDDEFKTSTIYFIICISSFVLGMIFIIIGQGKKLKNK
jgi:hypothetical protein